MGWGKARGLQSHVHWNRQGRRCGGLVPFQAKSFASLAKMPAKEWRAPIYVGLCTIYSDVASQSWRITHASNRRKDYRFKWAKGQESWDAVVDFCSKKYK